MKKNSGSLISGSFPVFALTEENYTKTVRISNDSTEIRIDHLPNTMQTRYPEASLLASLYLNSIKLFIFI
jgi:hypothetical protein